MNVGYLWLNGLLLVQVVLVCSSDDDAGPLGNILSSVIDISKYLTELFPKYPNANKDEPPNEIEIYDFIIVGAGPAGSTLANRLSENPNWNILLLEAGEEPSLLTDIPFICSALSFSSYNWGYHSEKQDGFCRGCTNRRVNMPHGRVLGGSTVINYMFYVRGNRRDYQKWYEQGNPGWSYEDVLPYFLKSEDVHVAIRDDAYHHTGGLLNVSDIQFRTRGADVWVKAAQEAGYPYVDYNGVDQYGVSYVQTTTGFGSRWSAEKAFLRPFRNRPNLTIRMNALVTKVLTQNSNAYGVEYIKNGNVRMVKASKEVILSAGSLNSPQILMLSGIGPADHLAELGISVVKDLQVGQQMYDHASIPFPMFTVNESIVLNQIDILTNPKNIFDYVKKGTGPLASIGGVEVMTYFHTNVSDDPDPMNPDVELAYIGGSLNTDFGLIYRRHYNVPMATYNKIWKPLEGKYVFSALPMIAHPKSRGFIKLRSKNPFDAPLFYANLLSDPRNQDVRTFIAAIREVQRIVATSPFQRYDVKMVDTPLPGCEILLFDTDEYWDCAIRTIVSAFAHQVATCRMGPKDDKEAVVDNKLRVYGIKNLRVVDTSIIPVTMMAHTMAPAYMIGEKAADIIKQYWKRQEKFVVIEQVLSSL